MLMNYELQNIDTVVELMLKPYRSNTFATGRYGKNFGGQSFVERFEDKTRGRKIIRYSSHFIGSYV